MLAIERLSYQDAMILIEGAEKKAQEIGVPMCIAITDESGFLISFKRMDGGKPLSTTLAQDKAHTAAISRKSTQAYNEICQPGNLSFGIHISAGGAFFHGRGRHPGGIKRRDCWRHWAFRWCARSRYFLWRSGHQSLFENTILRAPSI